MPRITRDQYNKWNEQAQNGFEFDLRNFLIHGEKELRKEVQLSGGEYVEFRLLWTEEYTKYTNEYGVTRNIATGKQIPTLHHSLWSPSGSVFASSGMGTWETIGAAQDKKNYAALCKLSAHIDTEQYMTAYRQRDIA